MKTKQGKAIIKINFIDCGAKVDVHAKNSSDLDLTIALIKITLSQLRRGLNMASVNNLRVCDTFIKDMTTEANEIINLLNEYTASEVNSDDNQN